MSLVLILDHIIAVRDHTAAATSSLAGIITTIITAGTISTVTTSPFIILGAADFVVVQPFAGVVGTVGE